MTDENGFVTDAMLGKLTTYMRMAGHDVVYAPDEGAVRDDEVAGIGEREGRTIITRDVELAERTEGVLLEAKGIEGQLCELEATGLTFELTEPSRCSVCNGGLTEGGEQEAPEDIERAWKCKDCGKVYWKGSHWDEVCDTFGRIP